MNYHNVLKNSKINMVEGRRYVSPAIECNVVKIESGFAVSITDRTTVQEEEREPDTSGNFDVYF